MGEEKKSRILVIGGSGYIGKVIAKASAALEHPTFVLLRASTLTSKPDLIRSFHASNITILKGTLDDTEALIEALKKVDVVISTVAGAQLLDQIKVIEAIKKVGTIKRFLPSEFGSDPDHVLALEPFQTILNLKAKIRRAIEEAQIPYTYVSCNSFAGYFLSNFMQPGYTSPPKDKVTIYGHNHAKAIFVDEKDVATYTIKSVDDPKTLNKTLYMRPPTNMLSFHELVALWEKKIGKVLEKHYVMEEELVKKASDTSLGESFSAAFMHSIFVQGCQHDFAIGPDGVEACELYPEVKYTTVEEYLDQYV